MDFKFTSEQQLIRESCQAMVERDVEPVLARHDPTKPLPKEAMLEIYGALAQMGLMAPRLPEEHGGAGLSMLDYGLMFEILPPVISISILAQECTAARIYAESTQEQKDLFLPGILDGTKICCTATTEPNAGSNPREVQTRVEADGDELVINGAKIWISNAGIADIINTTCSEGKDERGNSRLRRVVVERERAGVVAREIPCLGLRQGHLGEVLYDNCRVPAVNSLGASGDAARLLTLTWNGNRPLVGLAAVHLAQKALDAAVEYAGVRKQFGKYIGGHQLVQKQLADIETAVVTSRLLCYSALNAMDNGERANGTSAMAKRYATTACEQAISESMQVHGAMGVADETGLEQLYRDVRMLPIPDGANGILALIQGRELAGIDAFR
ncbi:acyl-CoA dehydrogenase family protein [Hyphomonas adhaerens]|jgi:alkylation response protein AidB-like acyl-CoA dehydrogenase|uniref:acyl-CoA dehydrogenase family protein n=1 Tax=Hyphomonas adhaerens TaxID=81029 RepID=UPI002354F597|nr:acyl-CoA dehydrogenase family protein [Hyphomonas adhaerens]